MRGFLRPAALASVALVLFLSACGAPAQAPTVAPAAPTAGVTAAAVVPAPTAAAKTPKPGGILTIGTNQDAVGFDPQVSNATASSRILENIYSGLLRFNEKLEIQLDLAESYTVDSPTQYTFKLRKGVKFHNGRELKAADVKYSFERIKDPATGSSRASQFALLDSIATPDDYTVVLKLKSPYAPLLSVLAGRDTGAIVAKEVVEANGGKLDKVAVGTGPFMLAEYIPNTHTRLVKNPDYFIPGHPYLDGVTYQPIPDDTARSTAVRTGAVDMIEYAPPKDLTALKADPKIVITGDGNNNVRFLAFNMTVKPFDNQKVRQAIAWAIDRQQVMDAAVSGAGTPLTAGPFLPSFWPGLQQPVYKQDIAKAKQLLTEAGYPNGFTAKLKNTPTYSFLGNAGIVVQEQLKAVGINFEIVSLEWSVFLADYLGKNFEAAVSGYSAFADPDAPLDGTYVTGRKNNFMSYSNPKFDALVAQAAATSDQAQRAQLYRDAQTILLDDSPMVFLYAANEYEAMQSYAKGYVHYINGSHVSFRDMWLDKTQ
jgi:peptide/nickel transport system substrate-binding protein